MIEIITGFVLASAAGLNAYIPLLGLGLLARFTMFVDLPNSWEWLTSDWMLIILAILLLVEVLVDKFPVLDTINDTLQTLVRPASGGMVFAAGIGSETLAVDDPTALSSSDTFWPILIGVLVALVPHLLKSLGRPVLNAVTGGAGAVVASTLEDIGAVLLTLLAVIVPILALVLLIATIWFLIRRIRLATARRRMQRAQSAAPH